jgi:cytochrome P450
MSKSLLVVDFDHQSEEYARDGEQIVKELRAQCPVAYTPHHGGSWIVTSYEHARAVLADPLVLAPPPGGTEIGPGIRRALAFILNEVAVSSRRAQVEDAVTTALNAIMDKGDFDIVADLAARVTKEVIVGYLGFEPDERPEVIDVLTAVLEPTTTFGQPPNHDTCGDVYRRIRALVARRRARPGDDLTSYLVQQDEASLDDDEMASLLYAFNLAAIETTAALVSNSLLYLDQDRDLRERLQTEAALIHPATEEFLRLCSPSVSLARTVTRPVKLNGVQLSPGDGLLILVAGANRDENAFDDPESFHIHRGAEHLSFGHGLHGCLGAALARLQFQLLLTQTLARIPHYSVDLGRAERLSAGRINGWRTLPARTNL